ncbi:MAG: DUF5615 family PIN-like protein [Thiolinea sp.]
MRLLLDQGLPLSAAGLLRAKGIDTVHVSELGMSMATDTEILQFAVDEGQIVVTLDADFHSLLAITAVTQPSVIRIRIEGLKAPAFVALIQVVLSECQELLGQGCAIAVQEGKIRIHRLPIGGR